MNRGYFADIKRDHKRITIAEVYIERSAVITKGEKGREMWQIFFGF